MRHYIDTDTFIIMAYKQVSITFCKIQKLLLPERCISRQLISKRTSVFVSSALSRVILNEKCRSKSQNYYYKTYKNQRSKSSLGEESVQTKSQLIMIPIYGSFVMGFFLLLAIALREWKKMQLRHKGIEQMYEKAFGRAKMYTYKGVVLPEFIVEQFDDLQKFETRADDIWVISFPRSGTTWLQEIVYLINSNLKFDRANRILLDDRFPYLEFMYPGVKTVEKKMSHRYIKSHLPYALLPKSVVENKPKIIYIARNPKDVVVSYYHFIRLLYPVTRYQGSFDDFFDLFINDKVMYCPWWIHVLEFWEHRHDENILFLTYEELKKDTAATIDKIARFLGKTVNDEDKNKIIHHCSFEMMKNNPMTNHEWFETLGVADHKNGDFLRKGCVGDWTNHLSAEMNWQINEIVRRKFQNTDISFTYEGTHIIKDDANQDR